MAIRTRKLANGSKTYDVSVYTDGKHRHCETLPTLQEARIREAELKAQYSPYAARRDAITLNRYIDAIYWPSASQRLAATSLDGYEKEIRLRIRPRLGKLRLLDIDRAAIQAMMVDNCATACVARKALGVLKTILNEAIADGYITHNYATAKFAMPLDNGRTRDNGLVLSTFDEIRKALDIVDRRATVPVQRIAYSGFLQGLRPEERYALDWSCFDLESRTITVKEARVAASHKHGGVQDKETKTKNSTRTIPMHPDFAELLLSTPSTRKGAFIFSSDGGRISPSTARHSWSIFLRENPDCPPVTIENMRHSFATAYLSAGGRIEVLSRLLGHANISTTVNRYYRPDITPLRQDLQKIAHSSRMNRNLSDSSPGIQYGPEFDSPRLHHLQSELMQVIAAFLDSGQ